MNRIPPLARTESRNTIAVLQRSIQALLSAPSAQRFKTPDAGLARDPHHAPGHGVPVAAGSSCRKRCDARLGAAALLPLLPVCPSRRRAHRPHRGGAVGPRGQALDVSPSTAPTGSL